MPMSMRAVRFDKYGGPEVLEVREVEDPVAGPGRVVVQVKAAATNPGEISIREGLLDAMFPATFPSGEGTDLAGLVSSLGEGVEGFSVGQAVLGWSEERSSHAEYVAVPSEQLTAKPEALAWEVAGSIFVAPMAAYAGVDAVAPRAGETVVVSGAAGGVGSVAVQLARRTGAKVIGLASESNHDWLRARDILPVTYGEGQDERIRVAAEGFPIDAFVDTFGGGYCDLAIELGVAPERISTIIDFAAVERLGVKRAGSHTFGNAQRIAEVAALAADGSLEIPIARTYPLEQVREAFQELAKRHTHGKIVLLPGSPA
jgi:NADPH:quinone reductase-like Zn-dependent oxidoreductase